MTDHFTSTPSFMVTSKCEPSFHCALIGQLDVLVDEALQETKPRIGAPGRYRSTRCPNRVGSRTRSSGRRSVTPRQGVVGLFDDRITDADRCEVKMNQPKQAARVIVAGVMLTLEFVHDDRAPALIRRELPILETVNDPFQRQPLVDEQLRDQLSPLSHDVAILRAREGSRRRRISRYVGVGLNRFGSIRLSPSQDRGIPWKVHDVRGKHRRFRRRPCKLVAGGRVDHRRRHSNSAGKFRHRSVEDVRGLRPTAAAT
jgi:hypothetical protein